mgnify:CR=1 FL=1
MIRDTPLRVIVRTDLRGAVTGRYHGLTLAGDIVQVFLVFLVIYKRTQAREGAFLVLRLVASFRTFYEDFFYDTGVGVFPVVT